jgi:hypothetical protein
LVDFYPDVYLLQELRKSSMNQILSELNRLAPDDEAQYVAAVAAPKSPWKKISDNKLVGTDVAILINTRTIKEVVAKGFVRTTYKLSQSAPKEAVKEKRHAYALLEKKDASGATTATAAVSSLHYPKWREFSSNRVSQDLKRKWTKQIADKLSGLAGTLVGGVDHSVIAGDTNNFKCDMYSSCPDPSPMYEMVTSAPYSYRDAIIVFDPNKNPIDYLLTSSLVAAGGEDPKEEWTSNVSDPDFYSNHQIRWGLLETLDTTGPIAPRAIQEAVALDDPKVRVQGWMNARDGGSGVDHYQVWRAEGTSPFEMVGTVDDEVLPMKYVDLDVDPGEVYSYKVHAVDVEGHEGVFTPTVTCVVPANGDVDCLN